MRRRPKDILPIWLLKHPSQAEILRRGTDPVTRDQLASDEVQDLIDKMIPSMYAAKGIGLAAPQVGSSLRIAVIAKDASQTRDDFIMVNPIISPISRERVPFEEGCLSVPRVYGIVDRPAVVKLQAWDRHGQSIELVADGLFARVIQHEVDHLHGKLFIDHTDRFTQGQPPQ